MEIKLFEKFINKISIQINHPNFAFVHSVFLNVLIGIFHI